MDLGSDPVSSFWGLAILIGLMVVTIVLMFRRKRVFVRRLIRAIMKGRD